MSDAYAIDDDLVRRLPLPLAQLYRRAPNAKTPLERHLTAFYLWEASLKLLASVALAEYAGRETHDSQVAERLTSLARPSLGHWWEYVCLLVPALADAGDPGFAAVRDLLLGKTRDDLPRCAGLDALLRQGPEGRGAARATVRLTELFNRLVQYRNATFGHGAAARLPADVHERMASALLAAMGELLGRLDVLAGRRLLFVSEVRQAGGVWLVQRYELVGDSGRRIASLELPREATAQVPDGERVYLLLPSPPARGVGDEGEGPLRPLHPLLLYDAEAEECLFLNARRGQRRTEYLSYTTGRTLSRPDLGPERCRLLGCLLGMAVTEEQAEGWASQAEAADPARELEPAAPAGRQVGEFQLLSELGCGGMGVVYRAWQPSLGRQVALKCLLRPGDAKAGARFRREIRALGKVEHPHLVKVFTSGSDGDQWFYAMELVEGVPLAAVCEQLQTKVATVTEVDLPAWHETLAATLHAARQSEKPLSDEAGPLTEPVGEAGSPREPATTVRSAGRDYVRQVVELVRQVAEAAHALHERGVIHRDIKPGNILVSADGTQATLMDLGLAQLADDLEGRLTRTRQFVGTLRYASPEQILAVGQVDRRADVYSLGATLWELLTLRPMYGADEQMPTPELMRRIQYTEAEPVRKHHRGIPRNLEAILARCLEKDAGRRYASAGDLAEDLRRFLHGEPVQARPVGSWTRAAMWMRRNPVAAAGLVTALAGPFWVALTVVVTTPVAYLEYRSLLVEQAHRDLDKDLHGEATQLRDAVLSLANYTRNAANDTRSQRNLDPALRPAEVREWGWTENKYRNFMADSFRVSLQAEPHYAELRLVHGAAEPWQVYVQARRAKPGEPLARYATNALRDARDDASERVLFGVYTSVAAQPVVDDQDRDDLRKAVLAAQRKQSYLTDIRAEARPGAGMGPALMVTCIAPVFQTIGSDGKLLDHEGQLIGFLSVKASLTPTLVTHLRALHGADDLKSYVADKQGVILAAWKGGGDELKPLDRGAARLQELYPDLTGMFGGPGDQRVLRIQEGRNPLHEAGSCRQVGFEYDEKQPSEQPAVIAMTLPYDQLTARVQAAPQKLLWLAGGLILAAAAQAFLFWRIFARSGQSSAGRGPTAPPLSGRTAPRG